MDDMGFSTTVQSGDPRNPVIKRGGYSIIRVNSGRNRGSFLIRALRERIDTTAQDLEQLFEELKTMTRRSVTRVLEAKNVPYPFLIFVVPIYTPVNVTIVIAHHLTDTSGWHTESGCPKVGKNVRQENLTLAMAVVSATVFGLVDYRVWSRDFPNKGEKIVWKAAPLAITCIPILSFTAWLLCKKWKQHIKTILCESLLLLLYVAARIMLLVIAFISVRRLPASAYKIVFWSEFIPHF